MPFPYTNRNSKHASVTVRSPRFFNPTRIRFKWLGGRGSASRPGQRGFLGMALRRVVDNAYVKWERQASKSSKFENVEWVLPPSTTGEFTLDLIDASDSEDDFSYLAINEVEITADPVPTGGPLLAGTHDGCQWYRWQITKHGEPEVLIFEADSGGKAHSMHIYTCQGVMFTFPLPYSIV
eukprot:1385674-Amorphochlora_amoeboformis.AAC.1